MPKKILRSKKRYLLYLIINLVGISIVNLIIKESGPKQIEKELFYFLIIAANSSYLYFLCDIKKLSYFFKEYKLVLNNLIKELMVGNKNINKKKELLDKVSFKGFLFLTYLLKFLLPYFLSLLIFAILNLSSTLYFFVFSAFPYFVLLINAK
tara:strand:+ start:187 stop:642 length:456 start_codon:yes stop_codon:yes gene_type:complete